MDTTQTPPKNLRTILLATPKKTRRTKKYVPPVYKGKVYSGVRPSAIRGPVEDNWRINTLATATLRRRVDPSASLFRTPGISQSTLEGKGTFRTDDLATPPLRKLRLQKKAYSYLGPKFMKTMDKHIDKSWKSLYHFYDRKLLELKKKKKGKGKGKGDGKGKGKKGSKTGKGKSGKKKPPPLTLEERQKKFAEWAAVCALPKKIFLPPPGKPRKVANLQQIAGHMSTMARPNFVTKKFIRPSIDAEYVDPLKVSDAAKSYEISERVKKLAECPAHRLIREPVFKPGAVKRSALTCKVSPRFNELSVPRKTAKEKDTEFKENPFEISRNALKYKASARILELAKPTERT